MTALAAIVRTTVIGAIATVALGPTTGIAAPRPGPVIATGGLDGGFGGLALIGLRRAHFFDIGDGQRAQASQGRMVIRKGRSDGRIGLYAAGCLTPRNEISHQFYRLFEAWDLFLGQWLDPSQTMIGEASFKKRRRQPTADAGKEVEYGAGPALGG